MSHRGSLVLSLVPLALAAFGGIVPLIGSDFSNLGFVLAWLAAITAVTVARWLAGPAPSMRVFIDIVFLVLTLVVLAPEGGLWFVPAVVAQLMLDRRTASTDVQVA
jgi:hypothetical protein